MRKVLIPKKARGESAMFITFIETGDKGNEQVNHAICLKQIYIIEKQLSR